MKLAVCDDDRNALDIFERLLSEPEYGERVNVSLFSSAEELLEACRKEEFDLIFSDIRLGEADGIKTAVEICAVHPGAKIVFVTAHVLEYAEEIFSGMQPYGYIGKPVARQKVDYYITRREQELKQSERRLTVSMRGMEYDLLLSDVRYFESDRRQVHIHCAGEVITVYERLDNIEARLDDRFVRCHQSFAVNLDWVAGMESGGLLMRRLPGEKSDRRISISRQRLNDTRRKYFEYKGRTTL